MSKPQEKNDQRGVDTTNIESSLPPREGSESMGSEDEDDDDDDDDDDEEFYTPGSNELLDSRKFILRYSIERAHERILKQREMVKSHNNAKTLRHRRHINHTLSQFELNGAYTFKENLRALSAVKFNKKGTKIACGSWDGKFFLMDSSNKDSLQHIATLISGYHAEKVNALNWSPLEPDLLVTGGGEGNLNFWHASPGKLKPAHTLKEAHSNRIPSANFHPSGRFVASASFDQTWKLWDVATTKELLEQEGHDKGVFATSFHTDGSLIATGGLDAVCRVWDLRSGRSIAVLNNHVKGIYSIDWSPNGHHLATAGGDGTIKIWDMRMITSANNNAELYAIPAHKKVVSDVRFFHGERPTNEIPNVYDENDENPSKLNVSGSFLMSASLDGTAKLWSADNWICCRTLAGHNDRVTSCDISEDGLFVVSCGWDRNLRVWS